MIISIILGLRLFIIKNSNSFNLIRVIKLKKINFTIFISNQIKEIMQSKANLKKLNSLNSIISSSAGFSLENKKKLLTSYNGRFLEMYGLAELGTVSFINFKNNKKRLESVGKAVPGVIIKISNKKNHLGVGEILCKSIFKFKRYFKYKNNNKLFENGYFKTGDLGYKKNKYLYFVGRKKNILKINGITVYPEDIENNINKLNFIDECAISGVSNSDETNWLCLLYKKKKNVNNVSTKIRNYCMNNLSSFQIPRFYMNINKLPKNKMGKIDRELVKKIVIDKLQR